MGVFVSAVVLQEGIHALRHLFFRCIVTYPIGKGGEGLQRFGCYVPCLECAHIDSGTDLTGVAQYVAVVAEGDGAVVDIVIEEFRQRIICRTGIDQPAVFMQLEVQYG